MMDELRAVAELAVRLCGRRCEYKHLPPLPIDQQIMVAAETLAAAYLAEHPADDGEPVTEEWLRSVGFREVDLSWRGDAPNAFAIGAAEDVGDDLLGIWSGDGKCGAYTLDADGFDGSERWLCWTPTRGHVRRFASDLGVPLRPEARP